MATDLNTQVEGIKDEYKYGFHDSVANYSFQSGKGLTRETVEQISEMKSEPAWMRDVRLKALEVFWSKPNPTWGGELSDLDFNDIRYFMRAADRQGKTWDDVPAEIKNTFDKLGIPEAERKFLAGVGAQYDSEVVYHSLRDDLSKKGVIFTDMDTALREHEDLVKQYFGTIIPTYDNKFAALNTAVWSGGSFVYVPAGVKVDIPLQAYFRINAENMGQFERTLILVEEGAQVHYVEGCTAPIYTSESLHSAVVEVLVKKGGRCRYTTIQNWANNIYNLVTKRAVAQEDALMEWVDGNLGSRLTMKYPSVYMTGKGPAARSSRSPSPARGSTRTPAARSSTPPRTPARGSSPRASARTAAGPATEGLLKVASRRPRLEVERRLRRLDPRPASRSDTYPVHRDRRGRRQDRPRGQRLQDRRGAALLPEEPRPLRRRGRDPDRRRLHRAPRQGAADGIRRRDEQADPAPDGRLGRLSSRMTPIPRRRRRAMAKRRLDIRPLRSKGSRTHGRSSLARTRGFDSPGPLWRVAQWQSGPLIRA